MQNNQECRLTLDSVIIQSKLCYQSKTMQSLTLRRGLVNSKYILTVCFGDGFFGCEQPESSSGSAELLAAVISSLFLLAGCEDLLLVLTSFIEVNTLSEVDDSFFFCFCFFRLSAPSAALLRTTVFECLLDVDVFDFVTAF